MTAAGKVEPAAVRVRLLGEIAIDVNGHAAELPNSGRAVALLGWLALHPGPQYRTDIASALWPDVPDASARSSVRTALWALRRMLEDAAAGSLLESSRYRVGLRDVVVDVQEFAELLAQDRVDEALALAGTGEMLTGLEDEWALLARQSHRERLIALLVEGSEKAAAGGDFTTAVERARRATELDPLSETCARALMLRHEEAGDRSVALGVYARVVDRLRRELHVAPSEDTWRLAERIRVSERRRHVAVRPAVGTPMTEGTSTVVGRRQEFAAIGAAWRHARGGRGGVLVVRGDPGIGKTHLIQELCRMARADGALVAMGFAPEIGCAPYGPWSEIAMSLAQDLGAAMDGRSFTQAIAPLLPGLLAPTAPGPPDFERTRLTEGLIGLIGFAARGTPLLLVLEDMHVGDESSAAVLSRAARRIADWPVLIAWTRRHRPLPSALADAEEAAQRCGESAMIDLAPLCDDDIAALVRRTDTLSDSAVEDIVVAAHGSPLLALEASRALANTGAVLSEGLRAGVRAATTRLPMPARDLCAALAVAGRALSIEEACRRIGVTQIDLDIIFEQAHEAGLAVLAGDRLDFRHAMLRDAFYDDLPALMRARLHRAVAEDLIVGGGPERADEAARHLLAGGRSEDAVHELVRGAGHAVSLGAIERAESLLAQADRLHPDDADISLELAGVAAHRGRPDIARERFDRALATIGTAADPVALAAAHIRWAEWNTGPLCDPRSARESIQCAIEILDTAGVAGLRMQVDAQAFLALCEGMAGDPLRCEALLDALDERCSGIPAEPIRDIRRHVARSLSQIRRGRFERVADSGRAAAAIARSIGRQDLLYGSLVNAAAGLAAVGKYVEALGILDEIGVVPVEGRLASATEVEVQLSRAWLISRLERHDEALRVARSAHTLAARLDNTDLMARADTETGRILLRAGSFGEAADMLAQALQVPDAQIGRPMARLQRAEALVRSGDLQAAQDEVRAAALEPIGVGDWPDTLVARMSLVRGLIAAARGERAVAERQLRHAESCWRRRLDATDAGERYAATLADLGRPVIGLISPADELDVVLVDLELLISNGGPDAHVR